MPDKDSRQKTGTPKGSARRKAPARPQSAGRANGARRRPSARLVRMVESGLLDLAELVSAHVELLREAAGEGQTPAERSRAVADLERLVRASERLRALLGDVKSARTGDVARTLLEFMRRDEAAGAPEPRRDDGPPAPPDAPDGTAA